MLFLLSVYPSRYLSCISCFSALFHPLPSLPPVIYFSLCLTIPYFSLPAISCLCVWFSLRVHPVTYLSIYLLSFPFSLRVWGRAYRVIDALTGGIGVGVGGVADDVAADNGLVDVEHEADHHLNHHRHEQVTMDPRPVVLEAPAGNREGGEGSRNCRGSLGGRKSSCKVAERVKGDQFDNLCNRSISTIISSINNGNLCSCSVRYSSSVSYSLEWTLSYTHYIYTMRDSGYVYY